MAQNEIMQNAITLFGKPGPKQDSIGQFDLPSQPGQRLQSKHYYNKLREIANTEDPDKEKRDRFQHALETNPSFAAAVQARLNKGHSLSAIMDSSIPDTLDDAMGTPATIKDLQAQFGPRYGYPPRPLEDDDDPETPLTNSDDFEF